MKHLRINGAAMRLKVTLSGLAVGLLLAGCGGSNAVCTDPDEPYVAARTHEPLRVPAGLEAPDRSDAMAIPDVESTQPQANRTACLDEPPSYFRAAGVVARSPEEVIASWAQAWANRESDAVLALYSTGFKAPTESADSAAWLEQRREQVATGPAPDGVIEGLTVEPDGDDRRIAKFVQRFGANSLRKELTLVRESGSWRIVEEAVAGVK